MEQQQGPAWPRARPLVAYLAACCNSSGMLLLLLLLLLLILLLPCRLLQLLGDGEGFEHRDAHEALAEALKGYARLLHLAALRLPVCPRARGVSGASGV